MFKIPNRNANEKIEAQQEEILWRNLHAQTRNSSRNASAKNAPEADAETRQLLEISQVYREEFDDAAEKALLEMNAQAAFAPTHQRLMNAIETDIAARNMAAPNFLCTFSNRVLDSLKPSKNAPWRFAVLTALLTATAIGSHSVGYYRASNRSEMNANVSTQDAAALRVLPVQSLVNDFDASLHGRAPLEFVSNTNETAPKARQRLQNQLGVAIHLPMKPRMGAKLEGARRHFGWNRAGVQARYVQNGVRLAVYQMREPRWALGDLQEIEWNGRLFMTGTRGAYRVVVWRAGEDVMTLVCPLQMPSHDSLLLAAALREPEQTL